MTPQTVVSSGQDMHIRLIATPGGLGCESGWGFAADWSFQGQGLDICNPPGAVLTGNIGVLHDDAPDGDVDCSSGQCGDWTALGAAGYSDNLDCGVRIHADQPGQKIVSSAVASSTCLVARADLTFFAIALDTEPALHAAQP